MRQHFRALEEVCRVSDAQLWILGALAETPGIKVSRLSEALSVHVSKVSSMLDKLSKAGLVERLRSEEDRRVANLQLTSKGQTVLDRAPKPLTGLVPHALDKLPERTLLRLHEDLALLIRKMKHVDHGTASKPLATLVR